MNKISRKTAFCLIDVQERFIPTIHRVEEMCFTIKKSIAASKLFEMPLLYSEQYPKGLGSTVSLLLQDLNEARRFEKSSFSCFGESAFCEYLGKKKINSLLLCGIEAHVCVYQTALDALERGMEVFVVEDAVSSRNPLDLSSALTNLRREGAVVSTFECLFMQFLGSCKDPLFKEMSAILKMSM